MDNKNGGLSDSDNQMAGMALVGVVGFVALVLALTILPIVIGGFLIGLFWYGAYAEDGELNGEKLVWPIVSTLLVFTYLFGAPVVFTNTFQGVLFTDFGQWMGTQVWGLILSFNQMLPRKFEIRHITVPEVRLYFWSITLMAAVTLAYLHVKGTGKGVFIYKGVRAALFPVRKFAEHLYLVLGLFFVSGVIHLIWPVANWIRTGVLLLYLQVIVYALILVLKRNRQGLKEPPQIEFSQSNIVVGHELKRPSKLIRLTEAELNHHIHIIGASGFGKSVLLSHVIKNRIRSGSGLLFVDLKADFETIKQVVSTAVAGNRLDDLYIFSCGNPEFSSPYNVVARGTANQLKDRIMGALNWSEEYYKNEAGSFLMKLLRGLVTVRDLDGTDFDLGTILQCAEVPAKILSIIKALPKAESELRGQLEYLMVHLEKSENRRALQGLRSQLESLLLSDFGHLLKVNSDGIDLFEAIAKKKIVYVLLDSRTYGESARALGKLILQDLKAASARIDNEIPKEHRTAFSVVVDEFSDLATEDFIGFLDRARSSKIGVVVAHQELADLSRISPEFSRRLMNSTSTTFAFLQKLNDSSETIAAMAGTRKTKEVTEQAKSSWLFGDEKTGMKSVKIVDEFIIHPNVIKSLSVGECVMVQKYPVSTSAVVKVKPEVHNYLRDDEVKAALGHLQERDQQSLKPAASILKENIVVTSRELSPELDGRF